MEVFDRDTEAGDFISWVRSTLAKLDGPDIYATHVFVEAWEQAQFNAERFGKGDIFQDIPWKFTRVMWSPEDPEAIELREKLKERLTMLLAVLGGERDIPQLGDGRTFLAAELREALHISDTTLNSYAKAAGVTTPGKGHRDHRYSTEDASKICEHITSNVSTTGIVDPARKMLAEIQTKSKIRN
jgi:hypothetical protein